MLLRNIFLDFRLSVRTEADEWCLAPELLLHCSGSAPPHAARAVCTTRGGWGRTWGKYLLSL